MYSRQEASRLRQEFWTSFGLYMNPVLSAEGETLNWVNYRTGVKDIAFRMNADNKKAILAIELSHKEAGIRELVYEQFLQYKAILRDSLGEAWTWEEAYTDEHGKTVSRIYTELENASIFRKEDWPALISFFKPRIIALDEFWSQVKYSFQELS